MPDSIAYCPRCGEVKIVARNERKTCGFCRVGMVLLPENETVSYYQRMYMTDQSGYMIKNWKKKVFHLYIKKAASPRAEAEKMRQFQTLFYM